MQPLTIIFSHGKDSEPWGSKIIAMAERARLRGYRAESVDYRGIDEPQARVTKLLEFARELASQSLPGKLLLAGSSLGGHVAAAAANSLNARGLFLLAPAFYMPGFEQYTPQLKLTSDQCPISIVHGWRDDIVLAANSIRYAREHRAILQLIDADHRMLQNIKQILAYFDLFLDRVEQQ